MLPLASKCTIVWRPARTTSNSDCPGLTFAGRFPKLETTSRASLVRAEFLERQGRIDHLATQNEQNVTRSNSASVAVVDCLISSQICQICMSWFYMYANMGRLAATFTSLWRHRSFVKPCERWTLNKGAAVIVALRTGLVWTHLTCRLAVFQHSDCSCLVWPAH